MGSLNTQDDAYKNAVIPPHVKNRVGIEMGSSFGWERYIGDHGIMLGIDRFGASAKGEKVIEEYGFTVENVVKQVEDVDGYIEVGVDSGVVYVACEWG